MNNENVKIKIKKGKKNVFKKKLDVGYHQKLKMPKKEVENQK